MTPAARVAAAIDLLDGILAGEAAEKALTAWARSNRYAGSKDRAAVRDHVFDALRCRRSFAALGGAATGRGLMIGAIRAAGGNPAEIFTGDRFAPLPLTASEAEGARAPVPGAEALDCPDWLFPLLSTALGDDRDPVLALLRSRAPVHLRVNLRAAGREAVRIALAGRGIETRPHALSPSALEVVTGARGLRNDPAYLAGEIELQDAASQAVADLVPLKPGRRLLDFCAGGGGKTLAVAGRVAGHFFAHDAVPRRMADLPVRAERAGLDVRCLATDELAAADPFDVVLCDAPCSGSGSWRRDPEGKWTLTPDRLADLAGLQARILDAAAPLAAQDGVLVYATCSLLDAENRDQVAGFLSRNPRWRCLWQRRFTPLDGGDGFFSAALTAQ
ncbi:MAG: RsmB/NOP family class I SAM-dependent RNA methyltransferase [Rhodobacteraceae bacterium]|nr:RsmB/NOP family class I SAM-dependent RNA methyltransferase [Paracoccaceae bacterium]